MKESLDSESFAWASKHRWMFIEDGAASKLGLECKGDQDGE
jgi:hypothetical protein